MPMKRKQAEPERNGMETTKNWTTIVSHVAVNLQILQSCWSVNHMNKLAFAR